MKKLTPCRTLGASKITRGTFHIRFFVHPWIHSTDAGNAIKAKLQQSGKSRPSITLQHLLEDFFITTLANQRPWTNEQVRQIEISSQNEDFCERFARALEHGRAALWDKIDVFMLINWRELRTPGGTIVPRETPGLRAWHPKAAADLISYVGLRDDAKEDWYITRRKRLNLAGKKPYRVRSFRFDDEGEPMIDLR